MKFILQSVANYKGVIYELKREQSLIELFLENKYVLYTIPTYLYPIESYQAYKNMWEEDSCVSLQLSFHGMITQLYMTVF